MKEYQRIGTVKVLEVYRHSWKTYNAVDGVGGKERED